MFGRRRRERGEKILAKLRDSDRFQRKMAGGLVYMLCTFAVIIFYFFTFICLDLPLAAFISLHWRGSGSGVF
jgi:hypothetical protein